MRAAFARCTRFTSLAALGRRRTRISNRWERGWDLTERCAFGTHHSCSWEMVSGFSPGRTFRGDSSDVPIPHRINDLKCLWATCGYRDLTDQSNNRSSFRIPCAGTTFRHRLHQHIFRGPTQPTVGSHCKRSIYKSFIARSEFIWRHRTSPCCCHVPERLPVPPNTAAGFQPRSAAILPVTSSLPAGGFFLWGPG